MRQPNEIYKLGTRVRKTSGKPFKSGLMANTVESVVEHPHKNVAKHNSKELRIRVYAHFFEDAELTVGGKWVEDDNDDPKMPCVERNEYGKPLCWAPVVDPETGKILNWQEGVEAQIYYKTADMCELEYVVTDSNGNETVVCKKKGYVPKILELRDYGYGYGDYVYVDVASSGQIYKWNKNLFNDWVLKNTKPELKNFLV